MEVNTRVILNMFTHPVNYLVVDIKNLPLSSAWFHDDLLKKEWLDCWQDFIWNDIFNVPECLTPVL